MKKINIVEFYLDGKCYQAGLDENITLEQGADSLYNNINEFEKLKISLLDGSWLVLPKSALQRCHLLFTTILVEDEKYLSNAMKWWNALSSAQKTRICDTNTELVGAVRRWESLTGIEIQTLYDDPKIRRDV